MKLREFNFNDLRSPFRLTNLCVKEEGAKSGEPGFYEKMTIGETLRALPLDWADREIKNSWWFFDTYVIEVERV